MNYKIFILDYEGFYTVHFSSKSLGATLFCSQNKGEAEAQLLRYSKMGYSDMINYLQKENI